MHIPIQGAKRTFVISPLTPSVCPAAPASPPPLPAPPGPRQCTLPPVAASHTRTVRSSPADTTMAPLGTKATSFTTAWLLGRVRWPARTLRQAARGAAISAQRGGTSRSYRSSS
eukprot:1178892-Prorocentrum_minimum.AAC.11